MDAEADLRGPAGVLPQVERKDRHVGICAGTLSDAAPSSTRRPVASTRFLVAEVITITKLFHTPPWA